MTINRWLPLVLASFFILGSICSQAQEDSGDLPASVSREPSPTLAQDWPGWRGGNQQGRISSSHTPVKWSSTENVIWKTPLPGNGYSSPVVADGKVYLTTAYVSPKAHWSGLAGDYSLLVLIMLATASGLPFILGHEGLTSTRSVFPRRFVALWFFSVVMIGINIVVLAGQGLFSYEKSEPRKWIVSSLLASLCLILSAFQTRRLSLWRPVIGSIGLVFAGVFLYAIPWRTANHPLAGEIWHADQMILLLLGALPFTLGLFLVSSYLLRLIRSRKPSVWREARACEPLKYLKVGFFGLISVCVSTAFIVIVHPRFNEGGFIKSNENGIELMGWYYIAGAAVALLPCALARRRVGSARVANLTLFIGSLLFTFIGGAKLVEILASYSGSFSAKLGNPSLRLNPSYDWWAVGLLVSIYAACAIHFRLRKRQGAVIRPRLTHAFRVIILILGAVGFINSNYVRGASQEFVRAIICLNAGDGTIRWTIEGLPFEQGRVGTWNSPATPTPVVDGDRIFAYFGTAGLMCADLKGNLLWTNRNLPYECQFGPVTSPVVSDGILMIVSDMPEGTSYLWALDCKTGKVLWSINWPADERLVSGNNRTPLITTTGGKKAILVWGFDNIKAFDIFNGEALWVQKFDDIRPHDVVASMVSDDACLYLPTTARTDAVLLTKLGQSGNPIVWTNKVEGPTCSSPVLIKGMLFMVSDNGIASCLDARSGQLLWSEQLEGVYLASVVANEDLVYFLNNKGRATIVRGERSFQKVSENDLGAETFASLAADSGGRLFIRTATHLFCIGSK